MYRDERYLDGVPRRGKYNIFHGFGFPFKDFRFLRQPGQRCKHTVVRKARTAAVGHLSFL